MSRTNGKFIVLGVPILKHITVFSDPSLGLNCVNVSYKLSHFHAIQQNDLCL